MTALEKNTLEILLNVDMADLLISSIYVAVKYYLHEAEKIEKESWHVYVDKSWRSAMFFIDGIQKAVIWKVFRIMVD